MNIKRIGLLLFIFKATFASPYDDGKYHPQKYNIYDDGRYYRPRAEGKYVPGDEGRYSYIYRQGIYPADERDYRYIHQEGPADNGDYRYIHKEGPFGPNGPTGSGHFQNPGFNNNKYYLNHKIYAEKYKHYRFDKWIKEILEKVISFYNNNAEQSETNYEKTSPQINQNYLLNCSVWDGYDSNEKFNKQGNLVSLNSIQGEKTMSTLSKNTLKKFKLSYHVFIKVYEV